MKFETKPVVDRSKSTPITALFVTAVLIFIAGAAFSIYSAIENVHFSVMNASIHGSVWGMVMMYLGVRYLVSVRKLKAEVFKSTSQFSWSHFRKEHPRQR